jgi:hypothetical protein
MLKYYRLFGQAGIICGLICVSGIFIPAPTGLAISIFSMLPGFLFSSLYVMVTTRNEIETPKINPGYMGMLLCSVPVILVILSLFIN